MDSLKLGSGPNSCMYSSSGSRRTAMAATLSAACRDRSLVSAAVDDDRSGRAAREPSSGRPSAEPVEIEASTRLPGGASRETWSFSVRERRRGAADAWSCAATAPGRPVSGLGLEAALVAAAARGRGPRAPGGGWRGRDGPAGVGAAFMIMEFVEGETIPRRILRDESVGRGPAGSWPRSAAASWPPSTASPPAEVPGLAGGDPLEQLRGLARPARSAASRLRARPPVAGREPAGPRSPPSRWCTATSATAT